MKMILRIKSYISKLFNNSKEESLFEKRLTTGYYDRPILNNSKDFTKTVLERDTMAIEDFTKSKFFKELINLE